MWCHGRTRAQAILLLFLPGLFAWMWPPWPATWHCLGSGSLLCSLPRAQPCLPHRGPLLCPAGTSLHSLFLERQQRGQRKCNIAPATINPRLHTGYRTAHICVCARQRAAGGSRAPLPSSGGNWARVAVSRQGCVRGTPAAASTAGLLLPPPHRGKPGSTQAPGPAGHPTSAWSSACCSAARSFPRHRASGTWCLSTGTPGLREAPLPAFHTPAPGSLCQRQQFLERFVVGSFETVLKCPWLLTFECCIVPERTALPQQPGIFPHTSEPNFLGKITSVKDVMQQLVKMLSNYSSFSKTILAVCFSDSGV